MQPISQLNLSTTPLELLMTLFANLKIFRVDCKIDRR